MKNEPSINNEGALKPDTANKRTKEQILEDRVKVAEMFVQSYSLRQIADEVCKDRPYKLSHVQICQDIKAVVAQWKIDTSAFIDERMESDLMKLEKIENEAWLAWERSKGKRITKTQSQTGGETTRVIKEEALVGDPKFLEVIRQVLQDRANLLGYMAPKKVDTTVSVSLTNKIAEMGADAIQNEVNRLRLANSLN
jgi:hypothetical protein